MDKELLLKEEVHVEKTVEGVVVEFDETGGMTKDWLEVVEIGKGKLLEEELGIAKKVKGTLLKEEVELEKTVEAEVGVELVKTDEIAMGVEGGDVEIEMLTLGKQG